MTITNTTARDEISARIVSAKNGKRRGVGSAFRTDSTVAQWLARDERAVGIVGSKANLAIYSPAGARENSTVDRVLFYDATKTLVHEDFDARDWFDAAYARAA